MGTHPLNLALRFVLEMCALISVGLYGWNLTGEWFSNILAFLFPTILAIIWGVFAVPNDPSRSGKAPIPISGIIRLVLEIGIFAIAIWALYCMGFSKLCLVFSVVVVIHYVLSYDRIRWLASQ
ncbi:YrdB family protein [Muriicola sp. E247]|uniref:YrdB family protein n=1 Tax=Muriicola sp. E247 TaxID=3242730 RepID=UPI00352663F3